METDEQSNIEHTTKSGALLFFFYLLAFLWHLACAALPAVRLGPFILLICANLKSTVLCCPDDLHSGSQVVLRGWHRTVWWPVIISESRASSGAGACV